MVQENVWTLIKDGMTRTSVVMALTLIACFLALILLYVQNIDRKIKINKKK